MDSNQADRQELIHCLDNQDTACQIPQKGHVPDTALDMRKAGNAIVPYRGEKLSFFDAVLRGKRWWIRRLLARGWHAYWTGLSARTCSDGKYLLGEKET